MLLKIIPNMPSVILNGAPVYLDAFPSTAEVDLSVGIDIETELRALPWQLQGMVASDDDDRALQQAARQREAAAANLGRAEKPSRARWRGLRGLRVPRPGWRRQATQCRRRQRLSIARPAEARQRASIAGPGAADVVTPAVWLCSVGGQSSEIVSLGRLDANRTPKGTISSQALSGVDQRLITGLAEARQRLSIVCRARGGGCCDASRVSYAVGMKRVARLTAITSSNGRTTPAFAGENARESWLFSGNPCRFLEYRTSLPIGAHDL